MMGVFATFGTGFVLALKIVAGIAGFVVALVVCVIVVIVVLGAWLGK